MTTTPQSARPRVGFLPVGLVQNETQQKDYDLGRNLVHQIEADIVESPLVWSQPDVLDSVSSLQSQGIDLLVQYVLNGMSAEQQTLAGVKSSVPIVLWALPINYSFASAVSAIGALRDRGRRARLVVSGDEPASVLPQLNLMARVAFSISRLQDTRLGTLGGILPNLPAAQYHRDILADKLGPQVVHIPIALFNAFLSTNDESDPSVNKEIRSLRRAFDVRVEDGILRKATRFHHALRDLTRQHRLAAVAMECHTELTPLFDINPCFGFADVDRDYLIGCEGDVLATVNMLMMLFLTGKEPCLGDVYAVRDGIVTLVHCGAGCRVAAPEMVVIAEQDAPDNPGLRECRDTKMAMCIPNPPAGEITLSRLYGQGCDQLHVACGTVLDADIRDRLKIHIRLHNPDGFMEQVCGNHYVLSHGDLRPEIRLLCEWLKLRLTET